MNWRSRCSMRAFRKKTAIEKLAKQRKISVQEIRDEINLAIEMGMKNPNPAVRLYWAGIPCKGARPTPEEVVDYLAKQV